MDYVKITLFVLGLSFGYGFLKVGQFLLMGHF